MAQARTLSAAEFEQLLAHIDTRKYAVRNRCMMLLTHWAGLRIGEVACLRWSDVVTPDGAVKAEIRLLPDMTKGRHPRTVFINGRVIPPPDRPKAPEVEFSTKEFLHEEADIS